MKGWKRQETKGSVVCSNFSSKSVFDRYWHGTDITDLKTVLNDSNILPLKGLDFHVHR